MKEASTRVSHSRFRLFWPILLMIILFSGSSGNAPATPGWLRFPHFDKVAHFFVFGLLATSIFRAFPASMKVGTRSIISVVLVSIFGFFDELRQGFNPERTMDYLDWIADTSGAFVAVFVYVKWPFYRHLLETSFSLKKKSHESRTSISENPGTAPLNRPAR